MKAVLVVFVLLLAIGGAGGWWFWSQITEPHAHFMGGERVEITEGSTTEQIAEQLKTAGIITETLPMRVYIKLTNAAPRIKAGTYVFESPISSMDVVKKLEQGGMAGSAKLTVIEGWNRWDVANAMAAVPQFKMTKEQAMALVNDPRPIKDMDPAAKTLEGYLYPDTYFITSKTTPKDLVLAMVNRFKEIWKTRLVDAAKRRKMTVHNTVVVGSLVETEAKIPGDRPKIASVIYNRLNKNMTLSLDSCIVYASKEAGKWHYDGKVYQSDLDRKTPYNTRMYTGLPPGPVGSPRVECMEAALDPSNTTYLYYVRNPDNYDGAHNFYSTPESFEYGVQALRNWEAKQQKPQPTKSGS
ncbi:MAG: endolytic transglycosylase MltG [Candidatus Obscuribacterales bacterium]